MSYRISYIINYQNVLYVRSLRGKIAISNVYFPESWVWSYCGFINFFRHKISQDIMKTIVLRIHKFTANDSTHTICYLILHFNRHLILRIKSKTNPTKIDIQQILMKPDSKLSYSKAICQGIKFTIHSSEYFHSNIDAALFCYLIGQILDSNYFILKSPLITVPVKGLIKRQYSPLYHSQQVEKHAYHVME